MTAALRAAWAGVLCAALAGCGGTEGPGSAGRAGGAMPVPGLVKAADPCALDPQVQGQLLKQHIRPLLTPRQREVSIFVDDCPTGVDAALTWTTGTGAQDSFDAFREAGWRFTPADLVEGWEQAVLGEAGGHQFRVDLSCHGAPLPKELDAALDRASIDHSGCFAEARLVR